MSNLAPPTGSAAFSEDLPITPGTRASAEEAFAINAETQTRAAGRSASISGGSDSASAPVTGRPPFPTRTSTNYIEASTAASLSATRSTEGSGGLPSQPVPVRSKDKAPGRVTLPASASEDDLAAQNAAAERVFLAEQDAAKRTSVDMRSTGIKSPTELAKVKSEDRENADLDLEKEIEKEQSASGRGGARQQRMDLGGNKRQMSWDQRDMRRLMQEPLMSSSKGPEHGYSGAAT